MKYACFDCDLLCLGVLLALRVIVLLQKAIQCVFVQVPLDMAVYVGKNQTGHICFVEYGFSPHAWARLGRQLR